MNPEIKKKWVEDLRTTSSVQGQGSLRPKDNAYCCLGRLCDIYASQKKVNWVYKDSEESDEEGFYIEDANSLLPGPVVEWAGLESKDPDVFVPEDILDRHNLTDHRTSLRWNLSELNDGGVPFAEIADLIEEFL